MDALLKGGGFGFRGLAQIIGVYRSAAGGRIAKSMGLAAVSDIANVLAQKEALGSGRGMVVNHKSTLSTALLHATGEAARKEGKRQMERIEAGEDYVIVKAGSSVAIQVSKTFFKEAINE